MCFKLLSTVTNVVGLSVGKKYLLEIVDEYSNTEEKQEKYRKEVEYFVSTIGDKEKVNKFSLPIQLYRFFNSREKSSELAYTLRGTEDEFKYFYLLSHMRKFYRYLCEDRKAGKLHLCFKLDAKEPEEYGNLSDTTTKYSSIMMKYSNKGYLKYYNRGNDSREGFTYMVCLFYFVIIGNLYRILRREITDTRKFLLECFWTLNPVITGTSFTSRYSLGEISAFSLMQELYQLHPSGKHLSIWKNRIQQSIEFAFTTLNGTFNSSLEESFKPTYRGDNNGKRLAKVLICCEGDVFSIKVDLIGLEVINDVVGYAVNKAIYDLMTDDTAIDFINYCAIRTMLSHTLEHKELLKVTEEDVRRIGVKALFGSEQENIITMRNERTIRNAFKEISPDNRLEIAKALMEKFHLKRYTLDKIKISIEFAEKDDKEISFLSKGLGSKQQAELRKMIKFVRDYKKKLLKQSNLNYLYKKVSYKC